MDPLSNFLLNRLHHGPLQVPMCRSSNPIEIAWLDRSDRGKDHLDRHLCPQVT
jgi:hypothetical protein